MDERAAFEHNIDQNPLDATNHLVYADKLQELADEYRSGGNEEQARATEREAAFRRAMGEWVGALPRPEGGQPPLDVDGGRYTRFPVSVDIDSLPPWAGAGAVPYRTATGEGTGDYHRDRAHAYFAGSRFHWLTRADMEEALRRAFAPPSQKLARRGTVSRRLGRPYRAGQ